MHDSTIRDLLNTVPFIEGNAADLQETKRQEVYDLLDSIIHELTFPEAANIQLIQSEPYSSTARVSLSMEIPCVERRHLSNNLFLHSALTISLETQPFLKYSTVYSIRIESAAKTKTFDNVFQISEEEIHYLITKLVEGKTWKFKPKKLQTSTIYFWREQQKTIGYKNTSLSDRIPAISVLRFFYQLICGKPTVLQLTSGKPKDEPRHLLPLDSWQVTIKGLNSYRDKVVTQFIADMRKVTSDLGELNEENIWYWGVDGKVERKQLVFRVGRAFIFIKVYGYGGDLFVGWNAYE